MPPQSIESQPYWNILNVDKSINIRKRFMDDKSNVGSVIKFNHGKNTKLITTTDEIEAKIQFITPRIDVCKDIQMDLTDITVIGKNTIPWWSVFAFFIIGSAQLIFGVVMNVFSVGAADLLGIRLIMEGAYDIGFATKEGIVHRELSWKFWLIQKSISFTTMLMFVGNGALNNAFNMIMFWRHGNSIFTQSVAEGWILALQITILEVAKTVGVHIVDGAVERGVKNLAMPQIQQKILKSAEETLSKSREVKRLLEIDARNGNNINENALKKKVVEIASPPQNRLSYAIINGIIKGFFNSRLSCLNKIFEYVEMLWTSTTARSKKLERVIEKMPDENHIISSKTHSNKTNKDKIKIPICAGAHKTNYLGLSSETTYKIIILTSLTIIMVSRGYPIIGSNQMVTGIDTSLMNQIKNYKAERRIELHQSNDLYGLLDYNYAHKNREHADMKSALELVNNLVKDGKAGLIHMGAISDIVGRPIKILNNHGLLMRHIGDADNREPLEVQYHPPSSANPHGHWTLPGGKEPKIVGGNNNCLFDVVANQTEGDSRSLRSETVLKMLNNLPSLASQISDIGQLKAHKSTALLEGGASYDGDAHRILEQSQGRRSANSGAPGHPRGHVSYPNRPRNEGAIDCVENYSFEGLFGKSGFLSEGDQDWAVHQVLSSENGRREMNLLNGGQRKRRMQVPMSIRAGQWRNGVMVGRPSEASGIVLVLEHHNGQQRNANADVFVRTAYPIR